MSLISSCTKVDNCNKPEKSTREIIEDYRLGLVSSYNLKTKVTYSILEELRGEIIHPQPMNLPHEIIRDTPFLDLESCEERYLLLGQGKNSIAIVDLQNESAEPSTLSGSNRISTTGLKWFPSDYRLFSLAAKKVLMIYDANELSKIDDITLRGDIISYSHSKHSSSLIAVTTCKHPTQLIDLRTGHVSSSLQEPAGRSGLDVAWSPTCEFTLASSNHRGMICLWDTRSAGSPLCTIRRSKPVLWLAFYPDGVRLATLSQKKENGLAVYNVSDKSRFFGEDVGTLWWSEIASCPISFHFGFMFIFLYGNFYIFGDQPSQRYSYNVYQPQKSYAFRPSTFQLYSGNMHGIKKYSLSYSEAPEASESPGVNFDEFTY